MCLYIVFFASLQHILCNMAAPCMIFVGGNSGAGKTTLLRALVCELRDEWSAETYSARNMCSIAWLELKNVRVFGRYTGCHNTKESASTRWGKIDGCDRLRASSVSMCREQLKTFEKQNGRSWKEIQKAFSTRGYTDKEVRRRGGWKCPRFVEFGGT